MNDLFVSYIKICSYIKTLTVVYFAFIWLAVYI